VLRKVSPGNILISFCGGRRYWPICEELVSQCSRSIGLDMMGEIMSGPMTAELELLSRMAV